MDISLTLIPFLGFVLSAVIIASAGHLGGTWAASLAAIVLWCGYTFFLRFWLRHPQFYSDPAWEFWLFGAGVALIQLILILVPSLLLKRFGWIPSGLIGGIFGATVAAVSFIPVVLIVGCMLGIDCL